jgi:hypothetical protein
MPGDASGLERHEEFRPAHVGGDEPDEGIEAGSAQVPVGVVEQRHFVDPEDGGSGAQFRVAASAEVGSRAQRARLAVRLASPCVRHTTPIDVPASTSALSTAPRPKLRRQGGPRPRPHAAASRRIATPWRA